MKPHSKKKFVAALGITLVIAMALGFSTVTIASSSPNIAKFFSDSLADAQRHSLEIANGLSGVVPDGTVVETSPTTLVKGVTFIINYNDKVPGSATEDSAAGLIGLGF